jgi:hypothetical protein
MMQLDIEPERGERLYCEMCFKHVEAALAFHLDDDERHDVNYQFHVCTTCLLDKIEVAEIP